MAVAWFGVEDKCPLFFGLVRAKFGLRVAASGFTASWEKVPEGRVLFPREGGSRMYIMNGMPRAATQELGGRRSPGVMESMPNKTRTEELVPEMRAALERPCAFLSVEAPLKDLDRGASLAYESVLGGDDGARANVWFHRFCALKEPLTPIRRVSRTRELYEFVGTSRPGAGAV